MTCGKGWKGRLMKTLIAKVTGLAGVALMVTACASAPPPVEDVVVEVPPPIQTPPPRPPVQETTPPKPVETGPRYTPGSIEDFRINVGERVYFDTDRYNLDNMDVEVLDRQAAFLTAYPNIRIMVAGNADERGTREYNLGLGERRANSVKDYLVSRGVSSARIETISYGKERPIDGRSTPEAWEINRNAHTQLVSGQVG